jgi:acetyl esterase/lipase
VLLLNAEYDDLRVSSEAFAAACAVASVDVRQVMVPGLLHGFLNMRPDIEPVGQALDLIAETVASSVTASIPA